MTRFGGWSRRIFVTVALLGGLVSFAQISRTDVLSFESPPVGVQLLEPSIPRNESLYAPSDGAGVPRAVRTALSPARVNGHSHAGGRPIDSEADEALLVSALREVGEARVDDALNNLETLTARNPKFRLAQLVYADLLLAKAQALTDFGAYPSGRGEEIAGLREEALMRLKRHRANPPRGTLPAPLLELSEDQRQAVVVDVSSSRLYVFENLQGEPTLVEDFYASTGKQGALKTREGDQRTPVGVYFVTRRIPSRELPDFYGSGALPVNYPNEWDAMHGRTGFGIWIHGVPSDTYSRVPRASDGCVALANADLSHLWEVLDSRNTPVIMADGIEWVDRSVIEGQRRELRKRLDEWVRDWESLDFDRYRRNYSRRFRTETKTYDTWMTHKRRVNSGKSFIDVDVARVSILGYPGEDGLAVVSFKQTYRSSNFESESSKRQYWRKEPDGVWRIVYEGAAAWRPEHIKGFPYSARLDVSSVDP